MALMKFYAQLDSSLICIGVSQLSGPVQAANLIELGSYNLDVLGKRYHSATGMWEDVPAAPTLVSGRRVSVLAFRRRFTPAERAAIEWAAVDRAEQPDESRMLAAALRASLADQAAATFIDMDDEDTITGVQAIEAAGVIAPGRAAEILTAPVQPEERP